MDQNRSSKAKTIIAAVVGGLLGIGAVWFLLNGPSINLSGDADSKAYENLCAIADAMNRQAPTQIDAMTVLKNTTAIPPRKLCYNYVVQLPEGSDFESMKKQLIPSVKNQVRTHPQMRELRDAKTTFVYSYEAPDGVQLFQFEVTPSDYE